MSKSLAYSNGTPQRDRIAAPNRTKAIKMEKKSCRMCGGPVAGTLRTKEHVIADWLLDAFGLQQHRIEYTPLELKGDSSLQLAVPNDETPRRTHAMKGLLLGAVCLGCNNGWMSSLEARVKPDLLRLVADRDAKPDDPMGLALWAQKTAYTLSQFLDAPIGRVPRAHGIWPRDNSDRLPQGVAVFHRQMPDWKLWFSAPLTFVVEGDDLNRIQARYRSAYRYMLQLGHAMFMVQFWPDSLVTLVYDGRIARLLSANAQVVDEFERRPAPPAPSLSFELLMSTRYETKVQRAVLPTELCHCGSGLELRECWLRGHRERLSDNWGWM